MTTEGRVRLNVSNLGFLLTDFADKAQLQVAVQVDDATGVQLERRHKTRLYDVWVRVSRRHFSPIPAWCTLQCNRAPAIIIIIIIIIIIHEIMFIVLFSWRKSPSSSDECSTAPSGWRLSAGECNLIEDVDSVNVKGILGYRRQSVGCLDKTLWILSLGLKPGFH